MDSQPPKVLEEILIKVEENNKMLREIRRSQKMASMMRLIYWLVIVGVSVGAFYFIQPYVDQVMNLYSGASETLKGLTK